MRPTNSIDVGEPATIAHLFLLIAPSEMFNISECARSTNELEWLE